VLGALPKSAHPGAKKALAEIWNAEDKDHARTAVKAFEAAYYGPSSQAAAKITGDEDELLAFYDYRPSTGCTCARPTRSSRRSPRAAADQGHQGPRVEAAGLAMAFKLIESAQRRWRMVNAPHLVALVRAGATFVNGKLAERPDDPQPADAAAEAA